MCGAVWELKEVGRILFPTPLIPNFLIVYLWRLPCSCLSPSIGKNLITRLAILYSWNNFLMKWLMWPIAITITVQTVFPPFHFCLTLISLCAFRTLYIFSVDMFSFEKISWNKYCILLFFEKIFTSRMFVCKEVIDLRLFIFNTNLTQHTSILVIIKKNIESSYANNHVLVWILKAVSSAHRTNMCFITFSIHQSFFTRFTGEINWFKCYYGTYKLSDCDSMLKIHSHTSKITNTHLATHFIPTFLLSKLQICVGWVNKFHTQPLLLNDNIFSFIIYL